MDRGSEIRALASAHKLASVIKAGRSVEIFHATSAIIDYWLTNNKIQPLTTPTEWADTFQAVHGCMDSHG